MRSVTPLIVAAFLILLFAVIVTAATMHVPPGIVHSELAVGLIRESIGMFVAAISAMSLLLKGISGANVDKLSPLVVPLLAGILLVSLHWAAVIGLSVIVIVVLLRQTVTVVLRQRTSPKPADGL